MPILTVTKDAGATVKPGPMVTAAPTQTVADDQLAGVASGSGLNAPFVADVLSMSVTHERDGVQLYTALGSMTANPMLQTAFKGFRTDTLRCVDVYEGLINRLGGSSLYASPAARMTEQMDAHLLQTFLGSGSADPLTLDMTMVDAVLTATMVCVANTELLLDLSGAADDGDAKAAMVEAASQLGPAQRERLEWARETRRTMAMTQANHPLVQKAARAVEGVVAKVKDTLS
jgi:hypothetical protein